MARSPRTPHDQALDELYAASPQDFVLVRTRLARELRAAGDDEAAADVRGRRRPNLAAWACNQVARAHPDELRRLFDATAKAATAQRSAGERRGADPLRAATRERLDLLEALTSAGVAELRGQAPKPETYRDTILATLDAASLDGDAGAELLAGHLTRTLSAPAGFGPPPGVGTTPPATSTKRDGEEAARRELHEARQATDAARAAAKTAGAEQTSAELQADAAAAHEREVERALERARDEAKRARGAATTARGRAEAAQQAVTESERRVAAAERRAGAPGR